MKKALLVVDYQTDFVADDGLLTVGKPAQAIEPAIAALAEQYDEADIYFTFDKHSLEDWETDIYPEGKIFPPHCIKGSKGYTLYGKIKGMDNTANWIEKHAYCPDSDFLMKLVRQYNHITVVGVVTDICVFQTVIGLYTTAVNAGIKLALTVDAAGCASFAPEREQWALTYLQEVLQVEILNKEK